MTMTWRADGAAAIPLAVWTAISPQPIIPIPSCSGTSPSAECWRQPLDHADGCRIDAPLARPYDAAGRRLEGRRRTRVRLALADRLRPLGGRADAGLVLPQLHELPDHRAAELRRARQLPAAVQRPALLAGAAGDRLLHLPLGPA